MDGQLSRRQVLHPVQASSFTVTGVPACLFSKTQGLRAIITDGPVVATSSLIASSN